MGERLLSARPPSGTRKRPTSAPCPVSHEKRHFEPLGTRVESRNLTIGRSTAQMRIFQFRMDFPTVIF
jgi:hypothetical protein